VFAEFTLQHSGIHLVGRDLHGVQGIFEEPSLDIHLGYE
jgi:hypothetical protein